MYSVCYSSYLEMAQLDSLNDENDTDGEVYHVTGATENSEPESEESDDNDPMTESRLKSDILLVIYVVMYSKKVIAFTTLTMCMLFLECIQNQLL